MTLAVRRNCLVVAALALVGALLLPGGAPDAREFRPSCDAVVQAVEGKRNVRYRVRCNFLVSGLHIRSSRPLHRVLRRPRLDNPDPGDRLVCRRTGARRGVRCRGETGQGVRIRGAYAVKGDPCAGLKTRFVASGGIDCDFTEPGFGCPDIGYGVTVRREQPRGC